MDGILIYGGQKRKKKESVIRKKREILTEQNKCAMNMNSLCVFGAAFTWENEMHYLSTYTMIGR